MSTPSDDQRSLLLRPDKGRILWFVIPSIVLLSLGVALIWRGGSFLAGLLAGFFGICSAVFILQLIPSAAYLQLSPEGFVVRSLFRTGPPIAWKEACDFRVSSYWGAQIVVFDEVGASEPHPKRLTRSILGGEVGPPETYGRTPQELANLMNSWRARYTQQP